MRHSPRYILSLLISLSTFLVLWYSLVYWVLNWFLFSLSWYYCHILQMQSISYLKLFSKNFSRTLSQKLVSFPLLELLVLFSPSESAGNQTRDLLVARRWPLCQWGVLQYIPSLLINLSTFLVLWYSLIYWVINWFLFSLSCHILQMEPISCLKYPPPQ